MMRLRVDTREKSAGVIVTEGPRRRRQRGYELQRISSAAAVRMW